MGKKYKPIVEYSEYAPVVAEWHPTKNPENISPNILTPGSHTKVWFICSKCSLEWQCVLKSRFSMKSGCPKCAESVRQDKARKQMTTITLWDKRNDFPYIIQEYHKDNTIPLTTLAWKSKTRVKWQCLTVSSHTWNVSPCDRVTYKSGCPHCYNDRRPEMTRKMKTTTTLYDRRDDFPDLIKEYALDNPIPITEIAWCSGIRCKWECVKGHIWNASLTSRVTMKTGCPICKESHLEKEVRRLLQKYNISFVPQSGIRNPLTSGTLKFDFEVVYNNIHIFIECQGKQHYIVTGFGSSNPEKVFEEIQTRDLKKKELAKMLNIPLIEIPYWTQDIEMFLLEKLEKHSKLLN